MYSCGEQCADEIERSGGEKVLIILEGWDELPRHWQRQVYVKHGFKNGLEMCNHQYYLGIKGNTKCLKTHTKLHALTIIYIHTNYYYIAKSSY